MYVNPKLVQSVIAYASIVFGVLTQALSGIHLPAVASAILGVFGMLLHPDTSVNSTSVSSTVSSGTQQQQQQPVRGVN